MGYLQAMSHGINDTHVGLMGNYPVDVILVQVVTFSNLHTGVRHVRYGILEYRSTLLIDVVHPVVNRKVRRRTHRTTSLHVEEGKPLTIGTKVGVHDTEFLRGGFHHESCCTITKDGAGGSIGIVSSRRHLVSTHNDDFLIATRTDEVGSHLHYI